MKKKAYDKGGKVNMCNAIAEWIKEEKDAGYADGYSEGKNDGYSEGKNDERAASIRFLVKTCLDLSQYGLTASEAEKYMDESGR